MELPPFTKEASTRATLSRHRAPLDALTGIRFFAAGLVVVFHSRVAAVLEAEHLRPLGLIFQHGYSAVTLFFLLSGLILAYTYSGQVERRSEWRRFYEARFARLWPLYFASLVASSLVFRSLPKVVPALATLLMVQAWDPWHPALAGTWNFVCWTLSCEALFYLLFPPVQRLLDRSSRTWLIVSLFVPVVISIAFNTNARTLDPTEPPGWKHWIPLAAYHVPEFLTGVALGNLLLRRSARPQHAASRLPGRGACTWLSAVVCLVLLGQPSERLLSLVVGAFAALLFGLASEPTWLRRVLSTRLLVLGGGISYAMYLFQLPVKQVVGAIAIPLGITSTALRLALNFALLLLASWALFRWLENPARLYLRRVFQKVEARRQSFRRASTETL